MSTCGPDLDHFITGRAAALNHCIPATVAWRPLVLSFCQLNNVKDPGRIYWLHGAGIQSSVSSRHRGLETSVTVTTSRKVDATAELLKLKVKMQPLP